MLIPNLAPYSLRCTVRNLFLSVYRERVLMISWPVLRVDGAFVFRYDGWIADRQ